MRPESRDLKPERVCTSSLASHASRLSGVWNITREIAIFLHRKDAGAAVGGARTKGWNRMAKQKTLHEKLRELGNNLWWSWQPEVTQIFRDIDPTVWTDVGHNPVLLLENYPPEALEKRATEAVLHTRVNWAYRRWQEYMEATDTWGATHAGVLGHRPTAYFSAEFGVHESLPIYSGGLGVLAGDHLKSASDLGIPLVGVGLFYGQGYFQQYLDENGWQQETYTDLKISKLPMEPALSLDG